MSDAASAPSDDESDASKQTVLDENHCHGCAAVSAPALVADISPIMQSVHVTLAPDYRVDVDRRPSDPPPPKSLN